VNYPSGFEFQSASPAPNGGNNYTWKFDSLASGASKKITITGKISGQEGDERFFSFQSGLAQNDSYTPSSILTRYDNPVLIKRPFLGLDIDIDEFVQVGRTITGTLHYVNNTMESINDVELSLDFIGDLLDKRSVQPRNGTFLSAQDKIIWNRRTDGSLAELSAGQRGEVGFSFSITESGSSQIPELKLSASANANRLSSPGAESSVVLSEKTLKATTNAGLASEILYFTGPFQNSGAMPPVADKTTTYTIVWRLTSNRSQVNNAKVSASLPTYVECLPDQVYPKTEKIICNPVTGEIVWEAGTVEGGAGYDKAVKGVAFQVEFNANYSHIGNSSGVVIVGEQNFSGVDSFTGLLLSDRRSELKTNSINSAVDTGFSYQMGTVIQ
jgi:hypothetical protein